MIHINSIQVEADKIQGKPLYSSHRDGGTLTVGDSTGKSHLLGKEYEVITGYHGSLTGQDAKGMTAAVSLTDIYSVTDKALSFVAAHLVSAALGGPRASENFTPVPSKINLSFEKAVESIAKKHLEKNKVIKYTATAVYGRSPGQGSFSMLKEKDLSLVPAHINVRIALMKLKPGCDPENIANWEEDDLVHEKPYPIEFKK